jgi:hypothetical protein
MNEEILKRIDALAAKLNTTGEHLWSILMKQVRIETYTCIGWIIFCSVSLYAAYRTYWWCKSKSEDWDFGGDRYSLLGNLFLPLVSIFLVIGIIGNLSEIPTLLLNPEFAAVKLLFGKAGK